MHTIDTITHALRSAGISPRRGGRRPAAGFFIAARPGGFVITGPDLGAVSAALSAAGIGHDLTIDHVVI